MYVKERYDPNDNSFPEQTGKHHRERYRFASTFLGKKYLDICSGQGYGVNILKSANPMSSVDGVEINISAVQTARLQYPKCNFHVADITKAFTNNTFDIVTFFEAIEHLTHKEGVWVLEYIYNEILNPGGTLVLSTPRDIQEKYNHFHKSVWPYHELKNKLGSIFSSVSILGQSWETGIISDKNVVDNDFYICVCSK